MVNRRRLIAALLSVVQSGLGQLYKGEARKALLFAGALTLTRIALPTLHIANTFKGLLLWFVGIFAIYIWNILDAARRPNSDFVRRWYNRWYYYLTFLAVFLSITALFGDFPYKTFRISAASEAPTLQAGDCVVTASRYYQEHPLQRGELVVFHRPRDSRGPKESAEWSYVKRVVAVGGDKVEVRGPKLFLNDQAVEEPFAIWTEGGIKEGEFGPVVVPAGHVFLLGDNRDHSMDSRFWADPFLPVNNVDAKVLYIYFSKLDWNRIGLEVR